MAQLTHDPSVRSAPKRDGVRRRPAPELVAFAFVVIALLIGGWAAVRNTPVPIGDIALTELKVRAMADGGPWPQLGAYSRMGWDHPGPAVWYLLLLGYVLFGHTTASLIIAATMWQVAMIGVAFFVARRRDARLGPIILLTAVAALCLAPPTDVFQPWNPMFAVTGVVALFVLVWDAVLGGRAGLWGALPLGTFLVQAHIGNTPVVAALWIVGAGIALWLGLLPKWGPARGRGVAGPNYPAGAACGGVAVAAVMWLPPLVQQFTGAPGNMSAILHSQPDGAAFGLRSAARVLTAFFANPLSWAGEGWPSPSGGVPWLLAVPVAATVVAVRRRDRGQCAALALAWAAVGAAALAMSRIWGEPLQYLAHYVPGCGCVLLGVGAWVLTSGLGAFGWRWVQAATVAAALGLAAVTVVRVAGAPMYPAQAAAVSDLAAQVTANLPAPTSSVYLDMRTGPQTARVHSPLVLLLAEAGVNVSVPADLARIGDPRMAGSPDGRIALRLLELPADTTDRHRDDPAVIARHDPVTPELTAQLAEFDRRIGELQAMAEPDGRAAEDLALLRYTRAVTAADAGGFIVVRAGPGSPRAASGPA